MSAPRCFAAWRAGQQVKSIPLRNSCTQCSPILYSTSKTSAQALQSRQQSTTSKTTTSTSQPTSNPASTSSTAKQQQSQKSDTATADNSKSTSQTQTDAQKQKPPRKTQADLDRELMQRMAGISGDGGEAGIEYEDGQPVAMKRGVKSNMFRYI